MAQFTGVSHGWMPTRYSVTTRTNLGGETAMIKGDHTPVSSTGVTSITGSRGGQMVCWIRRVTTATGTFHLVMVHLSPSHVTKAARIVAGVTYIAACDVIPRLTYRGFTIMAFYATARTNTVVIKPGRIPIHGGMTVIADVVGLDMRW